MIERRIRSIPPRTTLGAFREQEGRRGRIRLDDFSGSFVNIGRLPPREPGQGSLGKSSEEFDVKRHVFQKPTNEKSSRPLIAPENERIMWKVEIIENCNNAGDLGLIVQFSGINFISTTVFERSRRDYGPDSIVLYAPVSYKKNQVFLIFSTFGDIFESQVVPKIKDVNPFFQEEIYYPPLLTLYNPTSMRSSYNNGLFIVEYKARN